MTPYTLIRSDRRTLSLTVEGDGTLLVRAPRRLSRERIEDFLREKEPWIRAQLARAARWQPLRGEEGERLPYRGGALTLTTAAVEQVTESGERLLLPPGAGREAVADWLRRQALPLLREAAERQSAAMGIPCPPVRLTEARGRWGSCSPGGVIRLSWRLLLCPPPVLEHVVIHELCHLRHRDHGPEFHGAVAARDPAWREARRWLRENRGIMELL